MLMEIDYTYLIALILLVISGGWAGRTKALCDANHDYVGFLDSVIYTIVNAVSFIALIVTLIINWVTNGFLSSIIYLGIITLFTFLNGKIICPLLNRLFGYSGLGALLPFIACIASIIYLFIVQFA